MKFLLTLLGMGALGVLIRYEIQLLFAQRWSDFAQFGTLAINIVGSFLMGLIYVLAYEKGIISEELRVPLMAGFLGGFTTFSAYAFDSLQLMESGQPIRAFFYVAFSPALTILFCYLGFFAARNIG